MSKDKTTKGTMPKPKAWLLAIRPKTLAGACVPVVMALSLAFYDISHGHSATPAEFNIVAAVLCLLFAIVMQIDANLVNDYFDYRNGTDTTERLGPKRACTEGWITPHEMLIGIAIVTLLASLIGLPLIWIGGWWTVAVGAACIVFCFLYTTQLSRIALGDVLVLLFFGLIPVCATYYLQTSNLPREVILSSIACGLVVDTLLIVNNYRDYSTDRKARKLTLVVLIGRRASLHLYLLLGLAACMLGGVFLANGRIFAFLLPLLWLLIHTSNFRLLKRATVDAATMNRILSRTAASILLYGALFSLGCLI